MPGFSDIKGERVGYIRVNISVPPVSFKTFPFMGLERPWNHIG